MVLSADERELLRLIAQSPAPVDFWDFFIILNPAPPGLDENHPEHPAWSERLKELLRVALDLHQKGLVTVVHPANGHRSDLVEVTAHGRAALATA